MRAMAGTQIADGITDFVDFSSSRTCRFSDSWVLLFGGRGGGGGGGGNSTDNKKNYSFTGL